MATESGDQDRENPPPKAEPNERQSQDGPDAGDRQKSRIPYKDPVITCGTIHGAAKDIVGFNREQYGDHAAPSVLKRRPDAFGVYIP